MLGPLEALRSKGTFTVHMGRHLPHVENPPSPGKVPASETATQVRRGTALEGGSGSLEPLDCRDQLRLSKEAQRRIGVTAGVPLQALFFHDLTIDTFFPMVGSQGPVGERSLLPPGHLSTLRPLAVTS